MKKKCTCTELVKGSFADCPIHSITDLTKLGRQCGRTRSTISKVLGIPITFKRVKIEDVSF